jgi:hypothetical protein
MRSARCARVVECPAGSTSLSGVGCAAAAGQTEFDFDAVVGGKIAGGAEVDRSTQHRETVLVSD